MEVLPRDSMSELSQNEMSRKGFGDSISEYSVQKEMNKSHRCPSYSELHKSASLDSMSDFSDRSYKNILRAPFNFRGSVSEYADHKPGQRTPHRQDSISEVGEIPSDTSLQQDVYFRPIHSTRTISDHDLDAVMQDDSNRERFSFGASSPLAGIGAAFDAREQVSVLEARSQGREASDGKRVAWARDDAGSPQDDSGPPTPLENSPHNLRPTVSQHLVDDYTTYNIWNGRFQHGTVTPPPLHWKDDGLCDVTVSPAPPTPPTPRVLQCGHDHECARPPLVYPRSSLADHGPTGTPRIDSPHPRPLGALKTWSQSEKGEDGDDDSLEDGLLPTLPEDFPADRYPIYMDFRQQQESKMAGPGYLRGIENLGPKDHETCPCHFLTLPRRSEALSWTGGAGQPLADRRAGGCRARDACPDPVTGYPDLFCQDCQCRVDVCTAEVRAQIQANQRDTMTQDDTGSSVDGPPTSFEGRKSHKMLDPLPPAPREVKGQHRDAVTLTSEQALLDFLGPVSRPVTKLTSCVRYYRSNTAGVHERD